MASDLVRSGPTNYEDSTPEWASDTFAYRSPNKNPFLRFAYPRIKNAMMQTLAGYINKVLLKIATGAHEFICNICSRLVKTRVS